MKSEKQHGPILCVKTRAANKDESRRIDAALEALICGLVRAEFDQQRGREKNAVLIHMGGNDREDEREQ